ncbi:Epoxide hydrolase 4 [Desmophyllum pertusum]|uniref:Epoxide hydrolase 4 n=1 Tax=Desmophyllum pertusum TaxID=174260 RepID=A0A9X0CRG0_9CNID|nr:Epoxide hydrolase 4 [Desmophyllum pertusum]
MAKLMQSLFVYSIALFYGLLVSLRLLWEIIRNFGIPPGAKRRETPPSCLLDPDLGEHNFLRTASNLRIHYVAKGDPSKPLMLCLHGFPEFWYSWRYQLKAFSDDYRVVAMDMRGYAESDHPTGRDQYKLSYLVNDVKEMVTALGYSSCVLLCHDWGGVIGWSVAHIYPDLVDKLIVCNCPHPKCFQKCLQTSKEQFRSSWYLFFFQLPYLPEFIVEMDDYKMLNKAFEKVKNFTEEDVEAYKYALSQSGFTGPINYYRNVMPSDLPKGYTRTKIKAPTLVVWGTGDVALLKETLAGTDEYVADLTIKYVDGASHWVQMEEYDQVNKHIRDFLNAQPRQTLKKPD